MPKNKPVAKRKPEEWHSAVCPKRVGVGPCTCSSEAKLCPGCDQPMLPKGVKKLPNEYDHAQGCPYDKPVAPEGPTDTERLDWIIKQGPPGAAEGIGLNEEAWEAACSAITDEDDRPGDAELMRRGIDAAMRAARRKR